jgi:hypothetical protein
MLSNKSEKALYKAAICSLHELGVLSKTQKMYTKGEQSPMPKEPGSQPQLTDGIFDATSHRETSLLHLSEQTR